MRTISVAIAVAACLAVLAGCASSVDQNIEHAQFALDGGDWDGAISHAQAALAEDPGNTRATLQLSSAYAGRSGFTVLGLLAAIADESREADIFHAVRDAIGRNITSADDMRLAVSTLEDDPEPPAADDVLFLDFVFQLGAFKAIEAIGLPSLLARPDVDGPIDVALISEAVREIVQRDMADADDLMIEGGLPPDDDIVENMRQNYCALHRASAPGADGFDLAALRDMTLCQLSPDDGAGLGPGDFESPPIDSCSDFDYSLCGE